MTSNETLEEERIKMGEERQFPQSAITSSSPLMQDPLDVNEIQSMGWYEYFLKRQEEFLDEAIAASLQSCRVLVLSGTDLRDTYVKDGEMNTVMSDDELGNLDAFYRDKDKARKLQKMYEKSNVSFTVMRMDKYFQDLGSMDEQNIETGRQTMIEDIQNKRDTAPTC